MDLEMLDRSDLLHLVRSLMAPGVALSFSGKRTAMEIAKRVRPRVMRVLPDLSWGPFDEQAQNLIIEGENLQAMVTLYKYRGQVDLILTDPPYNTGNQFRYNDRWLENPNDPDLGVIVREEDGSRHTKWLTAMYPRLQMMHAMLRPGGVLAICIDDNELFRLGMMLDEIFGEENRIAVINWQKTYSPKNDSRHVASATEYVLVYARDRDSARTGLLPRTAAMDSRYRNPDNDPEGPWRSADLSAKEIRRTGTYGIQSPFTGEIHYPPPNSHWRINQSDAIRWLEQWGTPYVPVSDPNCPAPSLVLKGSRREGDRIVTPAAVLAAARERAEHIQATQPLPRIYFLSAGQGRPRIKAYLKETQQGRIPTTYWADDDYEEPLVLGTQSWAHTESGHSQDGIRELAAILGPDHGFETVKPLKLFKKIIHLWCPPDGLVLDPYAGSGTTGHAVLDLNRESGAHRRFILIEQGQPDGGDPYAESLTRERVKRAITGERFDRRTGSVRIAALPCPGGFQFCRLTRQIDAAVVMQMRWDELVDVIITSHFDENRRAAQNLIRIQEPGYRYLVGKNDRCEGYFIIWDGEGPVGNLDRDTFGVVLAEAERAHLQRPYHVYARYELYQSPSVRFYRIPDEVLNHLGLNAATEPYYAVASSGGEKI